MAWRRRAVLTLRARCSATLQRRWTHEAQSRLYAKPDTASGLGWFQDARTLTPPVVPDVPDASWFNGAVVRSLQKQRPMRGCHVLNEPKTSASSDRSRR